MKRGGDVCKNGCERAMALHGDGCKERPRYQDAWMGEWIAMSVAVHDIDEKQAPIRMVTRWQMMEFEFNKPPSNEDAPKEWMRQNVPMQKGQVMLRDPRVWHAGTENHSDRDRFLPGEVFKWDGTYLAIRQ